MKYSKQDEHAFRSLINSGIAAEVSLPLAGVTRLETDKTVTQIGRSEEPRLFAGRGAIAAR